MSINALKGIFSSPSSFYKTKMIKNITIYISILCASLFSAEYDVGDAVDPDDQD